MTAGRNSYPIRSDGKQFIKQIPSISDIFLTGEASCSPIMPHFLSFGSCSREAFIAAFPIATSAFPWLYPTPYSLSRNWTRLRCLPPRSLPEHYWASCFLAWKAAFKYSSVFHIFTITH